MSKSFEVYIGHSNVLSNYNGLILNALKLIDAKPLNLLKL